MRALEDFVGLPFADHGRGDGYDCWGLIRAVLLELRGLALPSYGEAYRAASDQAQVAVAIQDGLVRDFVRVDRPQPFDLVIFNIGGKPWHVGLVVAPNQFLHCPEPTELPDGRTTGGTSRLERLDDRMWHKRIEGYYRHAV